MYVYIYIYIHIIHTYMCILMHLEEDVREWVGSTDPTPITVYLRGTKGVPRKGGLNIGQHQGLSMQTIEGKTRSDQ